MRDVEMTAPRPASLAGYRAEGKADIRHGETRALHDYWQALRGGRTVPLRSELDPRTMPCQASRLFIIEVLPDGAQRFRLAGSRLAETFGVELRGMPSRTIMEGRSRDTFSALVSESVVEPGIAYARLRPAGNESDIWELLLLPLASEDGAIDRLIGILHPLGENATDQPVRFVLDEVQIRPIEGRGARVASAGGTAEEYALYDAAPMPKRPALAVIDGGGREGRPSWRPRPQLRVIK